MARIIDSVIPAISVLAVLGLSACAGTTTAEIQAEKKQTHEVKVIKEITQSEEGEEKVLVSIFTSDMDEPKVIESVGGMVVMEDQELIDELKAKGIMIDTSSGDLKVKHRAMSGDHKVVMLDKEVHTELIVGEGESMKHVIITNDGEHGETIKVHKMVIPHGGDGKVTKLDKHVVVVKSDDMSQEQLDKLLAEHGIDVELDGENVWIHDHGELSEHNHEGSVIILKDKTEMSVDVEK